MDQQPSSLRTTQSSTEEESILDQSANLGTSSACTVSPFWRNTQSDGGNDQGMISMDDTNLKLERLASYGHVPHCPQQEPPTDTQGPYSYDSTPTGPAIQNCWQPASAICKVSEYRPTAPDEPSRNPGRPQFCPPHNRKPGPLHSYCSEHPYQGRISAPIWLTAPMHKPHPRTVDGDAHDTQSQITHHPDHPHTHPYGSRDIPTHGTQLSPRLQAITCPQMMVDYPPVQASYGSSREGGHAYPSQYDPPDVDARTNQARAAQAYVFGRQRITESDEGKRECKNCKDNIIKCSNHEDPLQKPGEQILAPNERLEAMAGNQEDMSEELENFRERETSGIYAWLPVTFLETQAWPPTLSQTWPTSEPFL